MGAQAEAGLPSEAVQQADKAVEHGILCMEDGEHDLAIACFSEAIRLNPNSVRAYRLRGEVYSKTGKWANAERDDAKARQAESRNRRTVDGKAT